MFLVWMHGQFYYPRSCQWNGDFGEIGQNDFEPWCFESCNFWYQYSAIVSNLFTSNLCSYSNKSFHFFCNNFKNSAMLLDVAVEVGLGNNHFIEFIKTSNFFKDFHWWYILRKLGSYFWYKLTPISTPCTWLFILFPDFFLLFPVLLFCFFVWWTCFVLLWWHYMIINLWLLRYPLCHFLVESHLPRCIQYQNHSSSYQCQACQHYISK